VDCLNFLGEEREKKTQKQFAIKKGETLPRGKKGQSCQSIRSQGRDGGSWLAQKQTKEYAKKKKEIEFSPITEEKRNVKKRSVHPSAPRGGKKAPADTDLHPKGKEKSKPYKRVIFHTIGRKKKAGPITPTPHMRKREGAEKKEIHLPFAFSREKTRLDKNRNKGLALDSLPGEGEEKRGGNLFYKEGRRLLFAERRDHKKSLFGRGFSKPLKVRTAQEEGIIKYLGEKLKQKRKKRKLIQSSTLKTVYVAQQKKKLRILFSGGRGKATDLPFSP